MTRPVDGDGKDLKDNHMYRRDSKGELHHFKMAGIIYTEHVHPNEETKYENVGGVMIRVAVPKRSNEPREPPVSIDPVIILQSLVTPRPYGDYTQDALTPTQINIAKGHEYSQEEFGLLLKRMNYDEQRYRITLDRLEELRNEDKVRAERVAIEARNAASQQHFMENLPNVRKFPCGHAFDRRNAFEQSRFKKDDKFVYCPHQCKDGKLPLMELFAK